jgi:hypothetical protein
MGTNKELRKKFKQLLKSYHNRDNKGTYTLVWACTESGGKYNYQKSVVYKFGINKTKM